MRTTRLITVAAAVTVAAVPVLAATPVSAAPPPLAVFSHELPVPPYASPEVLGDFDNDGALDMFGGTTFEAQYSLTRGDGRGHFAAPEVFQTDIAEADLEAADVNADGWLDVVQTGFELPHRKELWVLATWLNDGAGNLTPPAAANRVYLAEEGELEVFDIDGDGTLDVVAGSFSGDLYWLHGDGDGGFVDPVLFASEGLPRIERRNMTSADMDGDGRTDLVVPTSHENHTGKHEVRIFYGNGSGFDPAMLVANVEPYGIAVGDMTGDGILDLVAVVAASSEMVTVPGDGMRGFGSPVVTQLPRNAFGLKLADVNLDGHLDVLALGGLYPGRGDGSFGREQTLRPPGGGVVGDFTSDGAPDLVGGPGPSLLVNLTGTVTGVTVHSVTVSESDGVARFTVARTGDLSGSTNVGITVTSGTATLGADFTSPDPAEVQFRPGQRVRTVAVPLIDDLVPEPTETFTVSLSTVQGAIVVRRTATATVLDND